MYQLYKKKTFFSSSSLKYSLTWYSSIKTTSSLLQTLLVVFGIWDSWRFVWLVKTEEKKTFRTSACSLFCVNSSQVLFSNGSIFFLVFHLFLILFLVTDGSPSYFLWHPWPDVFSVGLQLSFIPGWSDKVSVFLQGNQSLLPPCGCLLFELLIHSDSSPGIFFFNFLFTRLKHSLSWKSDSWTWTRFLGLLFLPGPYLNELLPLDIKRGQSLPSEIKGC